ncbi:MAG: hypothetical protein SGI97_09660 [candidate division Zixibacteria bacterium]|nr:hypothetical protein [candidate division Zixibacteria bacterium]
MPRLFFVPLVSASYLIFLVMVANFAHGGEQNISPPPASSEEANRVRIWVPIDRPSGCQVTIDIYAYSGEKVRRLLDRTLSRGFHNYYWDKLDDSGCFVPQGKYRAVINDCGKSKYADLVAQYEEGERDMRFMEQDTAKPFEIPIQVLADSILVSAEIIDYAKRIVSRPLTDSLLYKGVHILTWSPPEKTESARHYIHSTVKNWVHSREVLCPQR